MFFTFAPPRAEREELIDSQDPSEEDFARSFEDIAHINRYLGGTSAILRPLASLVQQIPADRPVRILDLATGSADIPRSIAKAFRTGRFGAGRQVEITVLDNHPKVLAYARKATPSDLYPEIRIIEGDVFALPYSDHTFDITLCSLAFHHFGYDRCVFLLREMNRLSSAGFIVNDLLRDALACGLIWILTRLVGAHPLTQHDGPLSVLRAYTKAEYTAMCRDANLPHCTVHVVPMYRVVIRG